MRRFALAVLTGSTFFLAGCDIDDFDSTDRFQADFHYNYPLKPGGSVSVETFNGTVDIVGWDQNSVDITGTKYARSEQLRDDIKIETTHSDSAVSVRAVRPSDLHGNMGAKFIIHVPKKVDLQRIASSNGHIEVRDVEGTVNLRTSNGRINAESIGGPLEASTSNGRITIHETEPAGHMPIHARTSNGSIDISSEKPVTGDIHASTSNGSITLRLPSSTAARVRASTSNSGISSDFDVTSQLRMDKHHLDGTLNNAASNAPLIDLSTSNGHIRLAKL
jgi:DUF4097 and DUF4098 domain-containing protein YvlB